MSQTLTTDQIRSLMLQTVESDIDDEDREQAKPLRKRGQCGVCGAEGYVNLWYAGEGDREIYLGSPESTKCKCALTHCPPRGAAYIA